MKYVMGGYESVGEQYLVREKRKVSQRLTDDFKKQKDEEEGEKQRDADN